MLPESNHVALTESHTKGSLKLEFTKIKDDTIMQYIYILLLSPQQLRMIYVLLEGVQTAMMLGPRLPSGIIYVKVFKLIQSQISEIKHNALRCDI